MGNLRPKKIMRDLIGQTLDGKYRIEKELGRGGMGAVYFAVHLGTKRPVAVKVIVPQFMQRAEFVERFRREAEAAGRLNHPNVVNVTDFGFTDTPQGKVAYLVMEYLDGCTLGEILQEEKKLQLAWTIDILEQVCSAVDAAHKQGIIHRDLKPDNIWLEPNQRGGYTVKVLDFGIAKLETPSGSFNLNKIIPSSLSRDVTKPYPAIDDRSPTEVIDEENVITGYETVLDIKAKTVFDLPNSPNLQPNSAAMSQLPTLTDNSLPNKNATKYAPAGSATDKNNFYGKTTAEITRVGAILGTPLYMSPEQCRGERLGTSSDVYSLGIIAYQMLAGKMPFDGEPLSILTGHLQSAPPKLAARKVPRKVKKVIHQALAKEPINRPPTAEIFAGQLRSYSEGVIRIFQRALVIFTENFSKLIWFSLLLYFPTILLGMLVFATSVLEFKGFVPANISAVILGFFKLLNIAAAIVGETLITGAVTWIVIRYIDTPLQSFRVVRALQALLEKWRQFAWILPLRIFINYFIQGDLTGFSPLTMFALSYLDSLLFWALPCVVMAENFRWLAALKRSWHLTLKAVPTVLAAFFLNLLISTIIGISVVIVIYNLTAFISQNIFPSVSGLPLAEFNKLVEGVSLIIVKLTGTLLLPFFAVVTALIYLKTRHAGGESLKVLLEEFKESNIQKSNWQRKIRQRLEQSKQIAGSFING